jgi:hypothetical protein
MRVALELVGQGTVKTCHHTFEQTGAESIGFTQTGGKSMPKIL